MKRTLLISLSLSTGIMAHAGEVPPRTYTSALPDKFIEIPVVILLAYLSVQLLLHLVKIILDNRLRKAMIQRGATEEVIKQLLQRDPREALHDAIRWCLLFSGAAAGFFAASFLPAGLMSLAVIALGISAGFLVYYLFLSSRLK